MGSEAVLEAWVALDTARALHPVDHDVLRSTEVARSLVVDLFAKDPRDLFNACARLGGLLAEAGASPSLAAGTIDSLERAFATTGQTIDAARLTPARAALVEGYVAITREVTRSATLASWDYPGCVVAIDSEAAAVACGYPDDDAEGLAAWASRVAGRLVKAKVKRVVLSGNERAKSEIAGALALVGIEVTSPDARKAVGWLRLPWKR